MKTIAENPKENCSGCSACYAACPKNCIKMKMDDEGFLYPYVGTECISCGKCIKVCPQLNPIQGSVNVEQEAYAAITKNQNTWRKSASGGSFAEICKAWGDGNSIVYGAAWNNNKVIHVRVNCSNLDPVLCSKYVASDINECYSNAKKDLLAGKYVVFSGTPCQIAGLRAYLNKDYDKLLLIDFVCHGVGSPKVFEDCITLLEKQFGKKISEYHFRAKKRYFDSRHIQKIVFNDNSCVFVKDDPYMQLFLSEKCLRRSCGKNCKYRNRNRQGDITLADYKGLFLDFPDLQGSKYNYTALVFNTSKSLNIKQKLADRLVMHKSTLEAIKRDNPLFYKQTDHEADKDFFEKYVDSTVETCLNYTEDATVMRWSLIRFLYDALPLCVRKIIYRYRTR